MIGCSRYDTYGQASQLPDITCTLYPAQEAHSHKLIARNGGFETAKFGRHTPQRLIRSTVERTSGVPKFSRGVFDTDLQASLVT